MGAPKWLQPVVWAAAGAVLVWGLLGHSLIWITHLTEEGGQLDRVMNEDLAVKLGHVDEEEIQEALGPTRGFDTAIHNESALPPGVVEEATWWNDYWRHHHVDRMAHPELYDLRAPGQLVAVYLVYFVPLFIVGLCGWVTMHWPVSNAAVWGWNSRIRAAFSRQVPPLLFWKKWVNGLSYSELCVFLLFFVPKVSHLIWFLDMSRQQWLEGVDQSYAVENPSEAQYWLERVGLWLAVDFQIQAPFLFAFAARGSLVNSYLGISFGTIIKWHRWMGVWTMSNIFMHGILYQVLLRSESASTWAKYYTRLHYMFGASSLSGRASWISMIVMGLCVIPMVRRKYYKVFYRVHIFGAALFVCFGIVHSRKVFVFLGPGLVLYGIDAAYRWLQATYDVTLHVNPGSKLVSIVIPLQEGVKYADGSHVWVAIPSLGKFEYHPFCVASTSADPAWSSSILLYCKSFNRWTERLLEGAQTGRLHKVTARVQGPFGGHNLPAAEMDAPQHMLVFVGGVGAPTVLSILKRLALHRDLHKLHSDEYPKVKVFHTARTLDEVILLAPLLDHPAVFDISLHYTGKTPLTTATLIMPSPVPHTHEIPRGHFACDTETLMQLHNAPNLKIYNGDASASIAASRALSRMLSEPSALDTHHPSPGRLSPSPSKPKKESMKNIFMGQEIGGFKKVEPTFEPDPEPRLTGIRGKWEGLVVWVGAWFAAFWTLLLGELWHNISLEHQNGVVTDQSRNHRRYRMAAFNILGASLMVPIVPLVLLVLCRVVRAGVLRAFPQRTPKEKIAPPSSMHAPAASVAPLTALEKTKGHSISRAPHDVQDHVWEESMQESRTLTAALERTEEGSVGGVGGVDSSAGLRRGALVATNADASPVDPSQSLEASTEEHAWEGHTKKNPRRHFNGPLAQTIQSWREAVRNRLADRPTEGSMDVEVSMEASIAASRDVTDDRDITYASTGPLTYVPEDSVADPPLHPAHRQSTSPPSSQPHRAGAAAQAPPPLEPPSPPDAHPGPSGRPHPNYGLTSRARGAGGGRAAARGGRAVGEGNERRSHTADGGSPTPTPACSVSPFSSDAAYINREFQQHASAPGHNVSGQHAQVGSLLNWAGMPPAQYDGPEVQQNPLYSTSQSIPLAHSPAHSPHTHSAAMFRGPNPESFKEEPSDSGKYPLTSFGLHSAAGSSEPTENDAESHQFCPSLQAETDNGTLSIHGSKYGSKASSLSQHGKRRKVSAVLGGGARTALHSRDCSSGSTVGSGAATAHVSRAGDALSPTPEADDADLQMHGSNASTGGGIQESISLGKHLAPARENERSSGQFERVHSTEHEPVGSLMQWGETQLPRLKSLRGLLAPQPTSATRQGPSATLPSRDASDSADHVSSIAETSKASRSIMGDVSRQRSFTHESASNPSPSGTHTNEMSPRRSPSSSQRFSVQGVLKSLSRSLRPNSQTSQHSPQQQLQRKASPPPPYNELSTPLSPTTAPLSPTTIPISPGGPGQATMLLNDLEAGATTKHISPSHHLQNANPYFGEIDSGSTAALAQAYASTRANTPNASGLLNSCADSASRVCSVSVKPESLHGDPAVSSSGYAADYSSAVTKNLSRKRGDDQVELTPVHVPVDDRADSVFTEHTADLSFAPSKAQKPGAPDIESVYRDITGESESTVGGAGSMSLLNPSAARLPARGHVRGGARRSAQGIQIVREEDSINIGREVRKERSLAGRSGSMSAAGDATHAALAATRRQMSGRQLSDRTGNIMDTCDDIPRGGKSGALFGGEDVENVVMVCAEDPSHVTIRTAKRGAVPVDIRSGRPDVAAEVNRMFADSQVTGKTLSVWSAGPGVLNHAVHAAAHALPLRADVRVFPMAYEL